MTLAMSTAQMNGSIRTYQTLLMAPVLENFRSAENLNKNLFKAELTRVALD